MGKGCCPTFLCNPWHGRCLKATKPCTAYTSTHCIHMQEGRRVLILDRDLSQPDRIIGELLQVRIGIDIIIHTRTHAHAHTCMHTEHAWRLESTHGRPSCISGELLQVRCCC